MTQSVDTDEVAGPPPSDGLSLVGDTKRFLKAWQRVLLGPENWAPDQITQLRQQSRELEARARAANVGGLAHHLQTCEHCFWNGEVDKPKLVQCLRNVSEVAWQWRQDLRTRSDVFSVEGQGQVSRDRLTIDPPTLLTPPSVEMFSSSPPAAASDWPGEPEPLDVTPPRPPEGPASEEDALEPSWAKRSVLQRWFGAGIRHADEPASEPPVPQTLRKSPLAFPTLSDAVYSSADSELPEASSREATSVRRAGGFRWWPASAGVAAVVGVAALAWSYGGIALDTRAVASAVPATELGSNGLPARRGSAGLPRAVVEGLLADAHGYGGIESPELADLLDGEAAELVESGGGCAPGALGCELIRTAALSPAPSGSSAAQSGAGPRAGWLDGLALPSIGVKDDPRVRQVFEFHTRNSVGREAFQELLFRCGAHRERVQATLARYGLPLELLALPMATSGCSADAESDDGARGLWPLTPVAARAYHLRVKPQVVDERIEPARSTDAGVRLLEDLHRKLGSWELAIAAFQLGPLALIARLRDAGEEVSYWALDDNGAVPPAAAKQVPKVQAYALILANLAKFHFVPAPRAAPEVTAELEVPPGTRLGLVARAAASSTSRIRELNPAVLGDRVPDWPGERFVLRVPREGRERAREALPALIASADHFDECVPHGFDWGRQRFTSAMASRCEHATQR